MKNMHNDPLVYLRTVAPGQVRTLTRVETLVDPARERRITYPVFLRDSTRRLILKYRDGGSGNEIYVVYAASRSCPTRRGPTRRGPPSRCRTAGS